jgi:hypothetical protein
VTIERLFDSMLTVGRSGDYAVIPNLPGSGVHSEVLRFSDSLRGSLLERVAALSSADRASFAKALAVYENTVGGLGSVTALHRVLPLIEDDDHALFDWILSNTRSYWYYAHGATSFAELQRFESDLAARRAQNEQREREREAAAKAHIAEQATEKLFNAVRRGDVKAVEALLRQGASANGKTPDGVPLAQFAAASGRGDIEALLRGWPGAKNTS